MKKLQAPGFLRRPAMAAGLLASVLSFAFMPEARPDDGKKEAAAPAAAAESASKANTTSSDESEFRTSVVEKTVEPLLADGEKRSYEGKFAEAKAKYQQALSSLGTLGSGSYVTAKTQKVSSLINRNNIKWANSEMERARAKYVASLTESDTKKAEALCNEAIAIAKGSLLINPELKTSVDSFVKDCTKLQEARNFKEATSLDTIDPNNAVRKQEILVLLKQAQRFYDGKQYTKVRDCVERILVMDPYNEDAIRLLDKTYKKLYKVAEARRENEVLERMAEVEWKWNQAVLPTDNIAPKAQGPVERRNARSGLYDKLQRIVFDNVEFEDANIQSVITYLNARSKELDPDKVGVNIVLQMTPEESAKVPKVNMSFDNIPMSDIIRYLCQCCGLKYRTEEKAVLIGAKDIDDMDIKFFQVRAALISSLSGGASDTEETGGGASTSSANAGGKGGSGSTGGGSSAKDVFGMSAKENMTDSGVGGKALSKNTNTATSEALMKYFRDRGVPFEEGSAIAYDKRAGKLIVKNTPENLRKLEGLLRDLDIQTPLVLIESKIMEIYQVDLEELGFDWVLSQRPDSYITQNNNNTAYYTKDYYVDNTSKVVRSYENDSSMNSSNNSSYKLVNNMSVLPNVIKGFDVNLTVNAIQQNTRSEVLSTPKVIATSGTTAVIRMVTEMYFPQSWTEPDASIGNNTFEYKPSYPEFGDATDIGIRFEVTPTVSPNNYTISLHLNPQIVALVGWSNYSYPVTVTAINALNNSGNTTMLAKVIMPEISRRDVNTNVKVYDGETVVLGGMLVDKSYQRDDKFPGLGEIPLIGRFFSSQMHDSQKQNLLIFVTSRLMSGDGVPVRTNPANGVFDFNR